MKICCIKDCNYPEVAKGICFKHYQRFRYRMLYNNISRKTNGEGSIFKNGYNYIRINGKRYLEHRYIMEQHLGRKLLPTEIIHHKDGNKLNNTIDNLEIMSCRRSHIFKYHLSQSLLNLGHFINPPLLFHNDRLNKSG